ncbi:MAG: NAD(P)/FAD-dependent oxidoreductase [Pseudomonadota bacterium]
MASTATDAIVIGAGHNGLAAALHLAMSGLSVVVLEREAEVGGAVRTAEVTRPGFRHDLYAMNLSLFAGSPFHAAHGETLAKHGLAFTHATDCFASPFPDGRWLGVSQDMEANATRVDAFDPADGARWRAMSAEFGADAPHFFALLGAPMGKTALAKVCINALRTKGMAWTLDAVRFLLSSPRAFLDENFQSAEVKALLAPWAMHLDFPPDAAGGALFPYLEAMADQSFGMALGKGGADVVPNSLRAAIEAAGGIVRTGVDVTGVEQTAGRAVAVRCSDGEVFRAKEAILASVTPHAFLGLVDGTTGRPAVDAALQKFRHGPGTLMIHVAASALPQWRAGEALQRFAYVHLAPTLAGLSRTYAEAMEGLLPAEPGVVVGQPTAIDPSRAPEGQHTLWIQVRVVPPAIKGDARGEIAATAWADAKEAMADRVMAMIEDAAPGFGETVLDRAVHSPDDLAAANVNLVGGDSLGGSHHLRQNFLFRPAPGMARYQSPVRGLYMIGSSTWPGAGVGAGSGFMAAKAIVGR